MVKSGNSNSNHSIAKWICWEVLKYCLFSFKLQVRKVRGRRGGAILKLTQQVLLFLPPESFLAPKHYFQGIISRKRKKSLAFYLVATIPQEADCCSPHDALPLFSNPKVFFSQSTEFMMEYELIQGFGAIKKNNKCSTGCVYVTESIQQGPGWPIGNFYDKCLIFHLPPDPRKRVLITFASSVTPGAKRSCSSDLFGRDLPPRSRDLLSAPWRAFFFLTLMYWPHVYNSLKVLQRHEARKVSQRYSLALEDSH